MRWFTWILPVLGLVVLVLGYAIDTPQKFQVSTGWIGLIVCLAAFLVSWGNERLHDGA